MSVTRHHDEWWSLMDISGPFLTLPVLERVLPQGLDPILTQKVKRSRSAYEEWIETIQSNGSESKQIHGKWIEMILSEILEFDHESLKSGKQASKQLEARVLEHDEILNPDFVVVNPKGISNAGKPRLLISAWPVDQKLNGSVKNKNWAASPIDRMTFLCRSTGVRLGLVTNGEKWTLVDAPKEETPGYATWDAYLWFQERLTLRAFITFLGVRRFFGEDTDTLERMLEDSVAYQEEVTDQLGAQVQKAVEVIVQALDKADIDRNRELLEGISPNRLYEASLTVMMRLVFLFCAEERGLLLLGDPIYDANYAVSTLRALLREEANLFGLEVLERRQDAWTRLLATFRAIYGGVNHTSMRLPALGGSLFDPDRYPFLEGRKLGTSWLDTTATPLPIDNRTVLHLLEALQLLQMKSGSGKTEGRRLSFRALDVEQIGHVYEGLLEHVAIRVDSPTIGLIGTKNKEPEISIDDLEKESAKGEKELLTYLKDQTGRSIRALRNGLEKEANEEICARLLMICANDNELFERVLPYHALIRDDVWGYPQFYPENSYMVTGGAARRETGTHYTPKALTESIVEPTLETIVYIGPADGKPREQWKLKSSAELLDLKICDPAMGSGAFLVQACRWLSERLIEAWGMEMDKGKFITVEGVTLDEAGDAEPMPESPDERLFIAQRLVAEKCLYGVDVNPLAVDLAKLSIWLVTLAKGRPFGFLDHNLRNGDSLLGIHEIEQLTKFSLHPEKKQTISIFASNIEAAVKDALALRKKLRDTPIRDIKDVQYMELLDQQARQKLEHIEHIADAMIGEALASGGNERTLETAIDNLSTWAAAYIEGDNGIGRKIFAEARKFLSIDLPEGKPPRKPFHWALVFPEVFEYGGFDGIVGNPPFLGGLRIKRTIGEHYHSYLLMFHENTNGNADLVSFMFLRAFKLLRRGCSLGLIACNTIAEGDTLKNGLQFICTHEGHIYRAVPRMRWPGNAQVQISIVHIAKSISPICYLNNSEVPFITSSLTASDTTEALPKQLIKIGLISFVGSYISGNGFVLTPEEANTIISRSTKEQMVIQPYLGGSELNKRINDTPQRFIINFSPKSEEEAREFSLCFDRVESLVKPHRMKVNRKRRRKLWWLFADQQAGIYDTIATKGLGRVLSITMTAMQFKFDWVSSDYIFDQTVVVITCQHDWAFALFQSSIHLEWAYRYGASFGSVAAPRYNPSRCFETFPFPETMNQLNNFGEKYHEQRHSIIQTHQEGLTKTINRFHDKEECCQSIQELRVLQIEMDKAVAAAYGWDDLDLGHGFHETKQGDHFTISEEARRKVLQRLLKLNHERYAEEVKQGLHDKKAKKKAKKPKKKGKVILFKSNKDQPSLPFRTIKEKIPMAAEDISKYGKEKDDDDSGEK